MQKIFLRLLILSFIAIRSFAAPPSPSTQLLDHLAGHWILSGTIAGKPTTHDISAEWILNHGYLRINEVSREKTATGTPAYEAIVLISIQPASDEVDCLWLDSTGTSRLSTEEMGRAKPQAAAIPFVFQDANGSTSFENTFSYDAKADSWQWAMANVQKGQRRSFGNVYLVRQK